MIFLFPVAVAHLNNLPIKNTCDELLVNKFISLWKQSSDKSPVIEESADKQKKKTIELRVSLYSSDDIEPGITDEPPQEL